MERSRVVITGLGAVTPIGLSAEESWQAAKAGRCGIGPITRYDPAGQKVTLAAEVKGFDPEALLGRREVRHMARFSQFAVTAARQAMADAALDTAETDLLRCGVMVSSGVGGQEITEAEHLKGLEKNWDRLSPFYIPSAICNMAAGLIAIDTKFQGPCCCPMSACSGGTDAVGMAFRSIRDGYADAMLCGGTEATITPMAIGGFTAMRALSRSDDPSRASIPFDKERSGFVMGEGAGILLLERLDRALARGAHIHAEIMGYGASCDAHHFVAPHPDGDGAAAAILSALADGGATRDQVDHINAHGTSTILSDSAESLAYRQVFDDRTDAIPISATKSMTGHMLGAAGAVEAIFTALSLRDGFLPPTVGYRLPDIGCRVNVVTEGGRSAPIQWALSTSFGFGGHNSCLLLRRWDGA